MNTRTILHPVTLILLSFLVKTRCAQPKALTVMADVVRAVSQGSALRYQIDDITKCSVLPGSSPNNLVLYDLSWEVRTARLNNTAGQRSLLVSNERQVNGSRSGEQWPVTRQVNVAIRENGTMDVMVVGLEYGSYKWIETYKYRCLWNGTGGGASVYQQDLGGALIGDFLSLRQAVATGYSLAYAINGQTLVPPFGNEIWVGRISDIRWNKNHSEIVFSRRWTFVDVVNVTSVSTAPNNSVIIQRYSYSRSFYILISSTTHKGFLNSTGSVHFFKLPYGE
ncbi:uncharacterized protein LOC101856710 [Aplysia californica]|uniref:Uncharacterized protein LOC101856710 n=1 Tax=Aplysia californica TaxID=6500 RepID=A0ABM0JDU6_APLCA|nr:uncharacterized protein LOC101856710 [Aplysia californica]